MKIRRRENRGENLGDFWVGEVFGLSNFWGKKGEISCFFPDPLFFNLSKLERKWEEKGKINMINFHKNITPICKEKKNLRTNIWLDRK